MATLFLMQKVRTCKGRGVGGSVCRINYSWTIWQGSTGW